MISLFDFPSLNFILSLHHEGGVRTFLNLFLLELI